MEGSGKRYIFHIYRRNGESLFLHPRESSQELLAELIDRAYEGRYGQEPPMDVMTEFRQEMYRRAEKAAAEWLEAKRFLPRFLLSAVIFLGIYFLTSIGIKDPLPVLDEALLALGGALGFYFFQAFRDKRTDYYKEKVKEVRGGVDAILFQEDPLALQMETLIQQWETMPPEQILKAMVQDSSPLDLSDPQEARVLMDYLEQLFVKKDLQKQERFLNSLDPNHEDWESATKNLPGTLPDLSLLAVYRKLKISCEA